MNQRSYKAVGINLKAVPMGEFDRLVTVLTKERGLLRVIAPGARKHKSKLGGRSGLFVVNDSLFSKGKSLDKLIQAETVKSFPGLSQNLAKLTASQYLAEIALAQALTDQPQEDLYYLLIEHLTRLEAAAKPDILACLAQATFHMLALAGVAPDVFRCCLSRSHLTAQLGNPDWRVGFSVSSGGAIDLAEIERLECDRLREIEHIEREWHNQRAGATAFTDSDQTSDQTTDSYRVREKEISRGAPYAQNSQNTQPWQTALRAKVAQEVKRNLGIVGYLSAAELALMQQLSKPELVMSSAGLAPTMRATNSQASSEADPQFAAKSGTIQSGITRADRTTAPKFMANSGLEESEPHLMWRHIEQFLRQYAQYQFDRPIKSAALIDTCFTSPSYAARV